MSLAFALSAQVLQAVTHPDTVIARVLPMRGLFEWTSGVLQIVVLLLGVAVLVTLVLLLNTVRLGVSRLNEAVERLSNETRPLIENANRVVGDARAVVTRVRRDIERVTSAAEEIGDRLYDAADTTAQRVDEVNAVLDVLQAELEDVAISAVSALRGANMGARAFGAVFGKRSRSNRRSSVVREHQEKPAVRARGASRDGSESA